MDQVFVYGTLKRGFPNHKLYLGPAEEKRKAVYCGEATTKVPYPLVVGGDRYVPFLLSKPGDGYPILGEVYSVDQSTLAALDILEGLSSGYYERVVIEVVCGETPLNCYVYMKVVQEDDPLLQLKRHAAYTEEEALGYKSRSTLPNIEILSLIHELDDESMELVEKRLKDGVSLEKALLF